MSFSSGVFSINSTGQPVVTGTTISSTVFNAFTADIATGLSSCMLKDGTQTITANIPMSSFKFTGLAAGTAAGNSLRYEQIFSTAGFSLLGPINETKTTVASASSPDIWTLVGNVVDYTGTVTATGFAAAPQAGARRTLVCAGAAVFTAGANMLIQGVASGANYTAVAGDMITVTAITTTQFRLFINPVTGIPGKQATRQVFTSGSGATYTTPSGATRINVRMVGGGGGGGGATANNGTAGNSSTFSGSSLTAAGGAAGLAAAGGVAAGGAGTNGDINISGGGGTGGAINAGTTISMAGGAGGNSAFGGGGSGGNGGGTGGNAGVNSGGGGGGGGGTNSTNSGGGGGAGAYVEKLILAPAATYTYTVGGAANGGAAGGAAGGNGAAGIIIVEEWYD